MMRINFVLPRSADRPVGGFKVVYKYAKKMADNKNDVHIYFYIGHFYNMKTLLKGILDRTFGKRKYRKVSWFNLKGVVLHFDQTFEDIERISSGKIIATHWSTADPVFSSKCGLNNKFYFIQGYEIFDPKVTKEILDRTWHLPLKKIVISKWLYNKGISLGVSKTNMVYVPNFIDMADFPIKREEYNRKFISFLWHDNPRKQSKMGISIEERLQKRYPGLQMVMFGVNVSQFPSKIKVFNNATIEQLNYIYRNSLVYFMPSRKEGWGLTGMEAMACGAAVASIDNGGIYEYASNMSALIVKNNEDELYNAICKLIDEKELRKEIINSAYKDINRFTFSKSYKKLICALNND